MGDAAAAAAHAQESYNGSQAALEAMHKKLEAYKRENKSLMSSYDQWLKSVVATRQPVVGASP
jgi:molybdopterin synthase catalytic subunit